VPWFKVDDTLHSHPKTRKAGLAAIGLWSVAGSWSMAYKTDGFVPDWFVTSWPKGTTLAAALVKAGKWETGVKDGEQGWYVHDWNDYQPSAEEIEADREAARDRQRRHRARLREARSDAAGAA
jgi:hypothetical protein